MVHLKEPDSSVHAETTGAIDRIAIGFDEAAHAFCHADTFNNTANDFSRDLAAAAFEELHSLMQRYFATAEFKAAREWDSSPEPGCEEPKHPYGLAVEIHSCRDELAKCAAVPITVRKCVGDAMKSFADSPRTAAAFASTLMGPAWFLRARPRR